MIALYYTGDRQLEIRQIPQPTAKCDEYLVHIEACGICGSDYEGYLGKTGRRIAPMIMGHECAGEVIGTPKSGAYPPGTRVAIFPKYYCGVCEQCRKGRTNLCQHAKFLGVMDFNGAMTEYIAVKEQYLVPFGALSFGTAAMAEPLAVAYSAIRKITDEQICDAEHILVVGGGTIGLMALLVLKMRGAKNIIVSDTFDARLDLAKSMGADAVINPAKEDFAQALDRLTDGKKCSLSVEAVGISPTANSALLGLKASGTSIWIGNAQKMIEVDMQLIVTTEITIKGNYIYSAEDFRECVGLLDRGEVDVAPLITDSYPLSKGVEAFGALENNPFGKTIKVMLHTH